jgi:hypothetical protein
MESAPQASPGIFCFWFPSETLFFVCSNCSVSESTCPSLFSSSPHVLVFAVFSCLAVSCLCSLTLVFSALSSLLSCNSLFAVLAAVSSLPSRCQKFCSLRGSSCGSPPATPWHLLLPAPALAACLFAAASLSSCLARLFIFLAPPRISSSLAFAFKF